MPKITIIARKAYGGAYCVMASKHIRTDLNFAYPTAEIAVMGPEGAVNVLYRRELAKASDPEALRSQKMDEFRERFASPFMAAEPGLRGRHHRASDRRGGRIVAGTRHGLRTKRDKNPPKKHGNIPL